MRRILQSPTREREMRYSGRSLRCSNPQGQRVQIWQKSLPSNVHRNPKVCRANSGKEGIEIGRQRKSRDKTDEIVVRRKLFAGIDKFHCKINCKIRVSLK